MPISLKPKKYSSSRHIHKTVFFTTILALASFNFFQLQQLTKGDALAHSKEMAFLAPLVSETNGTQPGKTAPEASLYPFGIIPNSPYAYSFVVGSFHENRTAYKGFLYNVLNAVYFLRQLGSTADFCLWAQLAPDSSLEQGQLPPEDWKALQRLGIHVIPMEKPTYESFAHLMYDKFRALQLTQYRRIMYLDSDVLPLANMDFWFHLSDEEHNRTPTILRPNLIWASRGAPCNGGMFMLHPFQSAWDLLSNVIERQRSIGQKLPYPHFDWLDGWGHNFMEKGDSWEAVEKSGNRWRFHGGHSDQGLWYFFAKYIVQDCSMAIGHRLQSFVPWNSSHPGIPRGSIRDPSMPIKVKEATFEVEPHSPRSVIIMGNCRPKSESWMCQPPAVNLAHFMGSAKPWQRGHSGSTYLSAGNLWFAILRNVSGLLDLGLDVDNWNTKHLVGMKESPLGYMPWWGDNAKFIMAKNGTNSTN